jgi:hypothetical protein
MRLKQVFLSILPLLPLLVFVLPDPVIMPEHGIVAPWYEPFTKVVYFVSIFYFAPAHCVAAVIDRLSGREPLETASVRIACAALWAVSISIVVWRVSGRRVPVQQKS